MTPVVISALVTAGADLEARNQVGATAVMSTLTNNGDSNSALVELCTDPDAVDCKGFKGIEHATANLQPFMYHSGLPSPTVRFPPEAMSPER